MSPFTVPISLVLLLIVVLIQIRNRRQKSEKVKSELRQQFSNQTVYLCDACEDLGANLIQFYGDPSGGSIYPGDFLSLPNGRQYSIKEVYAADNNPETPDREITSDMKSCAIVIEDSQFDFSYINQIFKTETIAVLKITPKQLPSN